MNTYICCSVTQSCLTLWDPTDCSTTGSSVLLSLLERKSVSHSIVSNSAIPWTVACQAPLSMEFFKQEYWSG